MSRLVGNDELKLHRPACDDAGYVPAGLRRISAPMAANTTEGIAHEVHRFATLSGSWNNCDLREQWERVRGRQALYRSPFFSYDFVAAVSQAGKNVEIALARRGDNLLALLPFVRKGRHDAMPVGAGVNDAHGLLAAPEYPLTFAQFLARCGLRSFAFHAAPPDAPDVSRYEMGRGRSFLADLTVDPLGYEHYLQSTSSTISRQGQKSRKLARQVGPLRLEYDCRDPQMIDYLIKLKGDQYQRTHTFNILAVDWIGRLLSILHEYQSPQVRGLLSVLYAGQTPVALHYGLLEGDWLHYWFPVYDEQYAYGSPGTQMFLDIARQAALNGVRAIDMGYSEQAYKFKLTNVITEMSYGLVDTNPWRRHVHRRRLRLRAKIKNLWFKEQLKPFIRRWIPNWDSGRYQQ